MAEHVQAALDQMVIPLRDLQDRDIFTSEEIKAIVKRRRASEYALRRRVPRKADFLSYIQAETHLESLRKLRMKRLARQQTKKEVEHDISKRPGDKHIKQLIHLLWTRTLRKYRDDLSLYLQYAEYCKETQAHRRLSQLYAQALQYHPKQDGLWAEASSHEFFQAGSVQNARILLQRGLRINPRSQELWLQSFVLELHFLQKLQGRKAVLLQKQPEEIQEDSDTFKMTKVIYDHAIRTFSETGFRLRFLEQCQLFPGTKVLKEYILKSIERDRPDCPDAWIARAIYLWESRNADGLEQQQSKQSKMACNGPHEDPVLSVIQSAINNLPTEEMYRRAFRFVQSYSDAHRESTVESSDVYSQCHALLNIIYQWAQANVCSQSLALELAEQFALTDTSKAVDAIQSYINKHESPGDIGASVWARLAQLISSQSGNDAAIPILEGALRQIPTDRADHLIVLLHLLGIKLASASTDADDVFQSLRRVLLLAAGSVEIEIDVPHFGIRSVLDACSRCLEFFHSREGLLGARKVYVHVLFGSNTAKKYAGCQLDCVRRFFDAAIAIERQCADDDERTKCIGRLVRVAVEVFSGIPAVAERYRKLCNEEVRFGFCGRLSSTTLCMKGGVPTLNCNDLDFSVEKVSRLFSAFQIVHLKGVARNKDGPFTWKSIGKVFLSLDPADQKSWCVETNAVGGTIQPDHFLSPEIIKERAYVSFLVQNDESSYKNLLTHLPVVELTGTNWYYEPALWFFFGRNLPGNYPLAGRPEHTDSVSHDGTWHFQLSGKKEWHLRPTRILLNQMRKQLPMDVDWDEDTEISICCCEGDVIVINTRLWLHRTIIAPQDKPSVSYARDFLRRKKVASTGGMTNLDGLFATSDIASGTVIFTEHESPAVELHRSCTGRNANCEVVELDDGTQAVVSIRDISTGEFFCIAPSDDSEEESESSIKE